MIDPAMPGRSLELPVPPDLTRCLGYPHGARYVAIYWDADSDSVRFNDGNADGKGAAWAWQAYARHHAVEPLLRPFDLTSFDSNLVLMIDQDGARASVATGDQAAEFLRRHRPQPVELSAEQVAQAEALDAKGWREEYVDQAEVVRAMDEQRGRMGRLMAWLDLCPVPPGQLDGPG